MTDKQLVAGFNVMADEHWDYVANASVKGKVDCSGAFVYEFTRHGLQIAHGSNTIWRQHMDEKGQVGHIDLVPGMAVLKRRIDGGEPEKYQGDGIGNFYHIGLYTDKDTVVHAKGTDSGVVRESPMKGWTHAGRLKNVVYTDGATATDVSLAMVVASKGETVNLRKKPDTSADLVGRVAIGSVVEVLNRGDSWAQVRAQINGKSYTGWMVAEFLKFESTVPGSPGASSIDVAMLEGIYKKTGELYAEIGQLLGVNG